MTPYTNYSDAELRAEKEIVEKAMDDLGNQLEWALKNDTDSGLVDALEEGFDRAHCDYGWLMQEWTFRGL